MFDDDALRIDCDTCVATGTTACNDCVVGHVLANEDGPIGLVVARQHPVAVSLDQEKEEDGRRESQSAEEGKTGGIDGSETSK